MKKLLLLLVVGAFVAPAAWAATDGNWYKSCQRQASDIVTGLSGGEWACWLTATTGQGVGPDTNSDDSPIINVGECENFSVHTFNDLDGDNTNSATDWTVEECPVDSGDSTVDTDGERDAACGTLPGTTALDGALAVDAVYGFDGVWIRLSGDGSGSIDDNRIILRCNEGPR